jgi:ribosomal-protein-alanine N-acetyltransferase
MSTQRSIQHFNEKHHISRETCYKICNLWDYKFYKDTDKLFEDSKNYDFFLVQNENELQAILLIKNFIDNADILYIFVNPKYRGQGLGFELLLNLEKWAQSNLIKTLTLEVHINNKDAKKLYSKSNFKLIARRDHYYGPDQHAEIYQKDLLK